MDSVIPKVKQMLSPLLHTKFWYITISTNCVIRFIKKSHYETLKLSKNCSSKEIRNSFIKLCKKYHPDTNVNDPNAQSSFIQIYEAYTILKNPDKRRAYDLTLISQFKLNRNKFSEKYQRNSWKKYQTNTSGKNPYFGNHRQSGYYNQFPFSYRGPRRRSNLSVVMMISLVAFIGLGLQFLIIKKFIQYTSKSLEKRSLENNLIYEQVRENAVRNGDNQQSERILKAAEAYRNCPNSK